MPEVEFNSSAIAEFWKEFQVHEKDMRSLTSVNDPLYDYLLNRLQKVHKGLFIEMSLGPGNHELIITAEGDPALFDLVELTVKQAPGIAGWTITALKPQYEFPVKAGWMEYTIEISKVFFSPLGKEGSHELGLELLVPGLAEEDIDKCHSAILRAIDHGLGERRAAEAIAGTIMKALPDDAPTDDLIPLVRLDDFIKWREKNPK